jgi:hypothetical protein
MIIIIILHNVEVDDGLGHPGPPSKQTVAILRFPETQSHLKHYIEVRGIKVWLRAG